MKIFIDIGHPAHVHYFRNFIKIMESKGHKFLISARDKEVAHNLLQAHDLNYVSRGKGKNGLIGKFIYIFQADYLLVKFARKFNPDLFLSFSSPYAAHVSKLLRKPHIAFDDTEHAKLGHMLYGPFTEVILSPSCFYAPFSKKQVFFDSYMEMCYLHPKYFVPNDQILINLGLSKQKKYVILRFVSWSANHDIGQHGLSYYTKKRLISELSNYAKVFISSEENLPSEFEAYKLTVPPEKLHDVLAFASLYIGEGSTTASECSVLGTPNVYVNSLRIGYCEEQQDKYSLCYNFKSDDGVVEKAIELLTNENLRSDLEENHKRMLSDKINSTDFMVWFVENYPDSAKIMREDPDYQYRFRQT